MSRPRKSMKEIRKIIRIKLQQPTASARYIAAATGCSRPVVKDYLKRLEDHPLNQTSLAGMNDQKLTDHLALSQPALQETDENCQLGIWLSHNAKRLSEKHMTRRLLHEVYLRDHGNGLQYSQFCFVLRQQLQTPEASGMFDHKAGDKFYLDFTGDKLHWFDEGGLAHQEEIFLAVLGASSYHFSLPMPSQKQEDFAYATQEAFLFLGGVPNAVVPDCLKSAVLRHDGYEPLHNPLFQRLIDHYNVVSIPARPHHPKDKPVVETAVKLLYSQILARLDKQVFANRTAMLAAWRSAVAQLNRTPFQKLPGSRLSRFEEVDKPALRPLPAATFVLTTVLNQTVQSSLSIYVPQDKTAYSVPCSLRGKKVEILVSPATVEIWHAHERYATHARSPLAGKVIMTEHLAPAQRWYANRNSAELIRLLAMAGCHVERWALKTCQNQAHEDIAWRKLCGLKALARKNPDRIDRVCRIALAKQALELKDLRHILAGDEDIIEDTADNLTGELPFHENVRGPAYYEQAATR